VDEELIRIREKKLREWQNRIEKSAGDMVFPVSQDLFPVFLRDHVHLVVDFWADWCGPCRQVSPVIDELAREFAGSVTFAKCNTDENPQLAQRLGISAIPTIMFFSSGALVRRMTGAYPLETIRAETMRVLGLPVK
jgi:thioredoxin 1